MSSTSFAQLAPRVAQPRVEHVPPFASSAAAESLALADACGLNLLPWQQYALTLSLGERADGMWAAPEVAWLLPRQNGKSYAIAARILAGLFVLDEQLITYTAHEFKTAIEVFRIVDQAARSSRATRRLMRPTRWSHGEETVELMTGQRFKILARTRGSGRGFFGDCVFLDEALEMRDEAPLAALMPTLAARPNPQLWFVSSAGDPSSIVLDRVRRRGMSGDSELCYLEWSADVDDDTDDERVWLAANPAAPDLLSLAAIGRERRTMTASTFAQERLGVWPGQVKGRLFPLDPWLSTARADVPDPVAGEVAVVFEVAPDRSASAISAAWRAPDGRPHFRLVQWAPGDGWLVTECARLAAGWQVPVTYDDTGPARDVASSLVAAGVQVRTLAMRDVTAASAALLSGVVNSGITHHPDDVLDAAAAGAESRKVGEAWALNRRSAVPVAPLLAGALAVWALMNDPVPELPRVF